MDGEGWRKCHRCGTFWRLFAAHYIAV